MLLRPMANSFDKNPFKRLQAKWYRRLAEAGFEDIECRSGYLKQPNRRTIAFTHREKHEEFFSSLGHYLATKKTIPSPHRRILELYAQGIVMVEISKQVGLSYTTVKRAVQRYRRIVLKG